MKHKISKKKKETLCNAEKPNKKVDKEKVLAALICFSFEIIFTLTIAQNKINKLNHITQQK